MVKPFSIYSFFALLSISLLSGCTTSETTVSVPVHIQDSGNAVGTVRLIGHDKTTRYEMQLRGLSPNENYQATLHGGSCENPSASFTKLSDIRSDNEGNATSRGDLLFRDRDEIELNAIADGEHAIVITSDQWVACGFIPAIDN